MITEQPPVSFQSDRTGQLAAAESDPRPLQHATRMLLGILEG